MEGSVEIPDSQTAARRYIERGWAPVPVPRGEKAPNLKGWTTLRLTLEDLPRYFNGGENVGVLLGEPSGGLVDVDLDAPEAVALARQFLPPTGFIFGRVTKPQSHWVYVADPLRQTAKFQDTDGEMLVELRSTGCQTIFPPSIHPEGEEIRFDQDGDLSRVDGIELRARVARLAAATALTRHWPGVGGRQDCALALSGALLRNGWEPEEVSGFVRAVAVSAGDEETAKRASSAEYTTRRLEENRTATGWPSLAEIIGHDVVDRLRAWLGLGGVLFPVEEVPRVVVIPWSRMIATESRPIDYHWPGWVPSASVALVTGAGDSFKSWLCLLLAALTPAGGAALVEAESEETRLKAGSVLYLAGENAIQEEERRCQLLKAGLGLPDDLEIFFVPAESLCLGKDEDYAEVIRLVEKIHPVAVFIDSAIALSGITRENDNAEVRAFMKGRILPLARRHRATVYLIQHSPKPPTQAGARFTDEHVARGASDWRNAADVVLYLRREPTLGEQAVVLRHAKTRVGTRHAPIWFVLEEVETEKAVRLVFGGPYDEETSQTFPARLRKAVLAAIDILKTNPGGLSLKTTMEQVAALGNSPATVRRALELVRGKRDWPYGTHRGKKHAAVIEDRQGREVFLVFDATGWPEDEDPDDA